MLCCASSPDGKARRQGLALWLLLLSIFTHAFVPLGSPLDRSAGSAFSISTGDVSLAAKKRAPLKTRQAQIRSVDDAGPDGSGETEHGSVPVSAGQRLANDAVQSAGHVAWPEGVLVSRGCAASFSARAPPVV